jgi:DNA-binding response OmpR family regulator
MTSRGRIIAVDDEPEIGSLLAEYLGRNGYTVRTAQSGSALDAELAREAADLILLDVNMPGEDGLSVARRLRASSTVRIIMVTAANEVIDKVVGLEIGADDYIVKPFNLRELQARVNAVMRRPAETAPAPAEAPAARPGPEGGARFGRMVLDSETRALVSPDGRSERLSEADFELLSLFARHPHRVLSRERLASAVGGDAAADSRAVDVRITRLRRRIESNPSQPKVIKTVRGAGYIFTGFGEQG